jgi:hypothetical protein
MTSKKGKRSSPSPKKSDVELVLARPDDDSNDALMKLAEELAAEFQAMRKRALAEREAKREQQE